MSNESTGQQMAVRQAGGSSWVAAAARAVYVTEQMTWVLLKYGHQSRSLMPLVEVKKFARLICQFCISLPCMAGRSASARGSNEEPEQRWSLLTIVLSSKARKMHFNLTLTKNISKLNELNYYLQVDQELDPYFCQHT